MHACNRVHKAEQISLVRQSLLRKGQDPAPDHQVTMERHTLAVTEEIIKTCATRNLM
jgi:hypothetical protein